MDKETKDNKCLQTENTLKPHAWISSTRHGLTKRRDIEVESTVSFGMNVDTDEKNCSPCCSVLKEFNRESTLHGPKYITRSGTSFVEKFCWGLVVIFSLFLGMYLTSNVVTIWQTNPIQISIDDAHYPLTKIDFPAVTICPQNKIVVGKLVTELCKQDIPSKLDIGENLTRYLEKAFDPYFNRNFLAIEELDYDRLENTLGLDSAMLIKLLRKSTPVCKDYLANCQWNGQQIPCPDLFRLKSTDSGFCCSFNSVPSKFNLNNIGTTSENSDILGEVELTEDFNTDYDYTMSTLCPTTPLTTNEWSPVCEQVLEKMESRVDSKIPIRNDQEIKKASGSGSKRGLMVNINPLPCGWFSTGSFYGSRTSREVIQVYIHDPKAFPEVSSKGMAVGPDSDNYVTVQATVTTTADRTAYYPNTTRRCNFNQERQLEFYKIYSRSNCELEKQVNIFQQICGCRPYYLPGSAKPCNALGMKCVNSDKVADFISNNTLEDCPPACETVTYDASISSVPLTTKNYGESILRVFFKHSSVVRYKRDQLYSVEDILGNIGGTLELCTGFSLVTLVEIIYFFTCRWLIRLNKRSSQTDDQ